MELTGRLFIASQGLYEQTGFPNPGATEVGHNLASSDRFHGVGPASAKAEATGLMSA
jgi:hypothetical protein